jgi:hypothetical protein
VGASSIGQSTTQQTQTQIVGGAEIEGGTAGMSVVEATEFAILRAQDQAGSTVDAVTGITETYSCDTGSGTISDDGDGDGVLEEGETWTATWNSCEFSGSTSTTSFSFFFDGAVAFSVTTCDNCDNADVDTVSWGYGFEIEYTDWLIQASQDGTPTVDILFDGTLQLSAVNDTSLGTTSFSVSGGPFTIDDRLSGNDYTYSAIDIDHEVDTTTGDYTTVVNEISLTSSNLGGEVTASTQDGDPFVGSGGYPTDGTLVISGANGSQAIVDAGQCGDAEFDLTINGSGEGCKAWESGI